MNTQNIDVVILAAGKGTRMRSAKAKVLHELAGRPLLHHVLDAALTLEPRHIALVVGHQADSVRTCAGDTVKYVEQLEQKGTGHAVRLAMAELPTDGIVIVLYGDVPLVSGATLAAAVRSAAQGRLGLVTAHFDDPAELGRIVRNQAGEIDSIVEFKDANDIQRQIHEINSGIMAVSGRRLQTWLQQLKPDNAQGEYYLTDVIGMAVAEGVIVDGINVAEQEEVIGVNDRVQLAQLERIYQHREAERLMREGVTIADPDRLDIRGRVIAGEDCFLDVNVVLQGEVTLGNGVSIGPGAVVKDSVLGNNVQVLAHTVVDGASIADACSVGPFARIRPGSRLDEGAKIGNFVEMKKARLGPGSKASHLAYLGDATIGASCNIGAGTVTCNYDGIDKHPTTLGDNVFVGTNSTLVAPLVIGDNAFVGAGSTVTTQVEAGDLAVGRAKQRNIKGWVRPDQRRKT